MSKLFDRSYIFSIMMAIGLSLVIDNWGHNHPLLMFPGWILFGLGLEFLIDHRIKESK